MYEFGTTMSVDDYVDLYCSVMQLQLTATGIVAPEPPCTRRLWSMDVEQLHLAIVQVDIVIHGHCGVEVVHQRTANAVVERRRSRYW